MVDSLLMFRETRHMSIKAKITYKPEEAREYGVGDLFVQDPNRDCNNPNKVYILYCTYNNIGNREWRTFQLDYPNTIWGLGYTAREATQGLVKLTHGSIVTLTQE